MKSVRALHVITGLGVGGAEQQLRLLLRHLPMRCDVLTLTNPGPVAEGLRADGVRVVHLGMRGNRDLGALPRLVRFMRREQYDLVHTHLYRACVYGRIAARLAGVGASVATEHSLGEREIEGRPLTRGVRGLYLASERLGAATVAVSDTVAARLEAWGCRPRACTSYRTGSKPGASASTRGCAGPPGPGPGCRSGRSWSAASGGWCRASGSTRWSGRLRRCPERICCWPGTGPSGRRCGGWPRNWARRAGSTCWGSATRWATARTRGPRGFRRCWPRWTCSCRRRGRRRSGWRWWRRWPRDCPSCTSPVRRSTTSRPRRHRGRGGSGPGRRSWSLRCAGTWKRARDGCPRHRWSAATTSPAARTSCSPSTAWPWRSARAGTPRPDRARRAEFHARPDRGPVRPRRNPGTRGPGTAGPGDADTGASGRFGPVGGRVTRPPQRSPYGTRTNPPPSGKRHAHG